MPSLFLVCPECNLEPKIREKFGSDAFFMTALGSVFDMTDLQLAEYVYDLVLNENISCIYVVNDVRCTFILNTVCTHKTHHTRAERTFFSLYHSHKHPFKDFPRSTHAYLLAQYNILRQAKELMHMAYIGDLIKKESLHIKGLVYMRNKNRFEELKLDV